MFAPQPVPQSWRASYPLEQILNPESFVREAEDAWASSPLSFGSYRAATPACPLTILQGDADMIIIGGWHAQLMHWLAPDTRLVWLKGVGHMVHHAAPHRVVEEIAALLGNPKT
jgi:pimeloyl-ACP methyl ester carboxylesterase